MRELDGAQLAEIDIAEKSSLEEFVCVCDDINPMWVKSAPHIEFYVLIFEVSPGLLSKGDPQPQYP